GRSGATSACARSAITRASTSGSTSSNRAARALAASAKSQAARLFRLDTKEVLLAPQEDLPIGNRRRGDELLADVVFGEDVHVWARSHHAHDPLLRREVDHAVAGDWRGVELLAQALFANDPPVRGIETQTHPLVSRYVHM